MAKSTIHQKLLSLAREYFGETAYVSHIKLDSDSMGRRNAARRRCAAIKERLREWESDYSTASEEVRNRIWPDICAMRWDLEGLEGYILSYPWEAGYTDGNFPIPLCYGDTAEELYADICFQDMSNLHLNDARESNAIKLH
ncbi:MAG: hypothetical protein SFX18_19540 [Pirellulales bacterium]|nr:hypothetical protein [Pirellulales bacterium]